MSRPFHVASDRVRGEGTELENATLLDFWSWAFGDLCDDDIKGIFAEWLVAKLLGISTKRRVSWANSDLVAPGGVGIEVKASSYWQSWKLLDGVGVQRIPPLYPISPKTQIRFAGLTARDATIVAKSTDDQEFKSQVYVFAFQNETDPEKWNAMDLFQWEFYVLPAKRLLELGWSSISLNMLRSQQAPLTYQTLPEVAWKVIESIQHQAGSL